MTIGIDINVIMHFPIRYLFLIWGIIYPKYKELTFPWNTYLFQIPPKCNRNILGKCTIYEGNYLKYHAKKQIVCTCTYFK